MVKIIDINWMSKEALEAEVTLTDNKFKLICFAHPLNYDLNDAIKMPLYCYETNHIIKKQINEFKVEKLSESFAYQLTGKLISKKDCVVVIGEIMVEVEKEKLPGDINEGDYISFNCKRVDIY